MIVVIIINTAKSFDSAETNKLSIINIIMYIKNINELFVLSFLGNLMPYSLYIKAINTPNKIENTLANVL